jgi:predicted transcriptional regulator
VNATEFSVQLPVELHAAIKAQAVKEDRSASAVARIAIREYLARANGDEPPGNGLRQKA